jgi:hypothetical protein
VKHTPLKEILAALTVLTSSFGCGPTVVAQRVQPPSRVTVNEGEGEVRARETGPSQPARAVWTRERARAWADSTGWLVGSNFGPSTAINQL